MPSRTSVFQLRPRFGIDIGESARDAEIARPYYGGHLSRLLWSTTRWKNFVSLCDCERFRCELAVFELDLGAVSAS
jgi:hypothetical protein